MKRLIEQESCDHGKWEEHAVDVFVNEWVDCPGGSSRELTVDLEAAAIVLHSQRSSGHASDDMGTGASCDRCMLEARGIVHAALGGG